MKLSRRYLFLGAIIIINLVIAILVYRNGKQNIKPWVQAEKIEAEFKVLESDIRNRLADEVMVSKLLTDSYTFDEFRQFTALPYGIVVYEHDSAVMWTNNSIIPVQAKINSGTAPLLITESNGSYILLRHDFGNSGISTIGFLPIQFEYGINNRYLTNIQADGLHVPAHLQLSIRPTDYTYPVRSGDGSVMFYVAENPNVQIVSNYNAWLYISLIILFICTVILLYDAAKWIASNVGNFAGIVLLPVFYAVVYVIIQKVFYTSILQQLELFNPHHYASRTFASSLGDLAIKSILFFVWSLFLFRNYKAFRNIRLAKAMSAIFFVLIVWVFVRYFNGLVLDSAISFNIHNFFTLDIYSLTAFSTTAILFLSILLIAFRCLGTLVLYGSFTQYILLLLAISLFLFFVLYLFTYTIDVRFIILVLLIAIVFFFTAKRKVRLVSFPSLLIWLLVVSGFSAFMISSALDKKSDENKRLYAIKKSNEKDALSEYLFEAEQKEIARRLALQLSASDTLPTLKQGLLNQLRQELQSSYFKKYDSDIFVFAGDSLMSSTSGNRKSLRSFTDAIEYNGEYTNTRNLYFINDNTGNYYYLGEIPVVQNDQLSVLAFVQLVPRKYNSSSLYPELLIDDELKVSESFSEFNYAVYYNNNLVERYGDYSYPIMDVFYVPKDKEFAESDINDYHHLVYRVNESKKVVVSQKDKSVFEPISYFSYLFFFYLICIFLILSADITVKVISGKINLYKWFDTTLQNKIQVSVISLIILAFVTLGVATVIYITNQYNISHREGLLTKIEAVQTNLDLVMNENRLLEISRSSSGLPLRKIINRINELSEVHDMDINIYGPGGNLLVSSQPDIFNRGLISRNMHPHAFFKMTCEKETWFIQTERIGNLHYLSAYVPVLSDYGEVMFYLNLPYFATEQNLRAEISSFLVALINVYVILLVMAGIIAYAVSRSITRPLAAITGTFKNIKLDKKNEPILWQQNDEIGLLVNEYNKMLQELEYSAGLLARSERESAWRDMAKQVAHEIKNPLTPMRLSIQHLQRALQSDAANVKALTEKVTKTLLEQIDNLSFIASEFSNFAIMPKAQNEILNLNEIIESAASLFKETSNSEIKLEMPLEKLYIWADKNQMLRVMNNLIKNALQAIPDHKQGMVHISLSSNGNKAIIKIADNGSGIPADIREKVFVPNFTTKSSGMGIGLAITKNIVESADGYIWFESEQDTGTTFYVELPIKEYAKE